MNRDTLPNRNVLDYSRAHPKLTPWMIAKWCSVILLIAVVWVGSHLRGVQASLQVLGESFGIRSVDGYVAFEVISGTGINWGTNVRVLPVGVAAYPLNSEDGTRKIDPTMLWSQRFPGILLLRTKTHFPMREGPGLPIVPGVFVDGPYAPPLSPTVGPCSVHMVGVSYWLLSLLLAVVVIFRRWRKARRRNA
jgi:hypothetical protein